MEDTAPVSDTEYHAELMFHRNMHLLSDMTPERLTLICRCYALTRYMGCKWSECIEHDMKKLDTGNVDDLAYMFLGMKTTD